MLNNIVYCIPIGSLRVFYITNNIKQISNHYEKLSSLNLVILTNNNIHSKLNDNYMPYVYESYGNVSQIISKNNKDYILDFTNEDNSKYSTEFMCEMPKNILYFKYVKTNKEYKIMEYDKIKSFNDIYNSSYVNYKYKSEIIMCDVIGTYCGKYKIN